MSCNSTIPLDRLQQLPPSTLSDSSTSCILSSHLSIRPRVFLHFVLLSSDFFPFTLRTSNSLFFPSISPGTVLLRSYLAAIVGIFACSNWIHSVRGTRAYQIVLSPRETALDGFLRAGSFESRLLAGPRNEKAETRHSHRSNSYGGQRRTESERKTETTEFSIEVLRDGEINREKIPCDKISVLCRVSVCF